MNSYDFEDRLDVDFGRRLARAGLGVAATGVFLAGYLVQPGSIFILSALSIYLTITAILGSGLAGALRPAAQPRLQTAAVRRAAAAQTAAPAYKEAA